MNVIVIFIFFEKVGCHDPPWLPILSQFHEVFVSHSRPFCDMCHPLGSWPSSAYFPRLWTLQWWPYPVDVVTSDHVTKVGRGDRGQSAYGERPPLGFNFFTILCLVIPEIWHFYTFINAIPTEIWGLQVKNRNFEGRKCIFRVESKNRKVFFISNL